MIKRGAMSESHSIPKLAAFSHMVVTAKSVPTMEKFFRSFFEIEPYFSNRAFCEFVLPNGFRLAFFVPTGTAGERFANGGERHFSSFGMTTHHLDTLYERAISAEFVELGVKVSGPPKDHPWGERSFLLLDPEGNRWEITQSPSESGMLVNR
jgi:hypothetical protein